MSKKTFLPTTKGTEGWHFGLDWFPVPIDEYITQGTKAPHVLCVVEILFGGKHTGVVQKFRGSRMSKWERNAITSDLYMGCCLAMGIKPSRDAKKWIKTKVDGEAPTKQIDEVEK